MEENMASSTRMAVAVVILAFVLSIGMTITMLATNYWDKIEYSTTLNVVNTQSMTAYQLAQKNVPVPVAAIWKVLGELDPQGTMCTTFVIYDKDGNRVLGGSSRSSGIAAGVTYITQDDVNTARKNITQYLSKKGYFSYALNEVNMYDIIINLID